jgi:HEPN domain-containing protein
LETEKLTRSDFQQLAEERILDAQALLQAGRFAATYYMSGLSVECALKACIARATNLHDFPDLKRAKNSYQHNLEQLADTAELRGSLDAQMKKSTVFAVNWSTASQWTVESRYRAITEADAKELFRSVTESTDGVLPWLRTLW